MQSDLSRIFMLATKTEICKPIWAELAIIAVCFWLSQTTSETIYGQDYHVPFFAIFGWVTSNNVYPCNNNRENTTIATRMQRLSLKLWFWFPWSLAVCVFSLKVLKSWFFFPFLFVSFPFTSLRLLQHSSWDSLALFIGILDWHRKKISPKTTSSKQNTIRNNEKCQVHTFLNSLW